MPLLAPETIDIGRLSYVSFRNRKGLPTHPSLYFVIREPEEIIYIGQARNPRLRWNDHRLLHVNLDQDLCRIAWLPMPLQALNDAEIQAIAHWRPRLNVHPGGCVPLPDPHAHYKKTLVRLPVDVKAALEDAALEQERSLNGQIVHALREWVRTHVHDAAERARRTPVAS